MTFNVGYPAYIREQGDKTYPKEPRQKFYNDHDDKTSAKHVSALMYHANVNFYTPLTYEGNRDVPTTFLFCNQDASMPFAAQHGMVAAVGEGLIRTYSCDGGHCSMLSMPPAVADVVHDTAVNGV
jgi:hypothetical protein